MTTHDVPEKSLLKNCIYTLMAKIHYTVARVKKAEKEQK